MAGRARISDYNILKKLGVFLSLAVLIFGAGCGDFNKDSQSTQKLVANPFISQLFGSTSKTIAITIEPDTHIAWMGLNQAGDYTYWSVDSVSVDGTKVEQEKAGSTVILENISASENAGIKQHQLHVTLTYSPLKPLDVANIPHQSYLLITVDKPKTRVIRVELNGFVRGVFEGKCTNVAAYEQLKYAFKNNEVALYVCDEQAVTPDLANDPDSRPFTNYDTFPIEGNFIYYLHPSEEDVVCLAGASTTSGSQSSIPDFKLPIPPVPKLPVGLDEIDVSLVENSSSDCTLDTGSGALRCDNNIELNVLSNAIPITLSLSNTAIEPTAKDCRAFANPPEPGGKFGDQEMTVLVWGEVGFSNLIESYKIDGALVLAVITLEKVEGGE